ncbi:MAG: DUF3892 domain-containing protein [Thermodesulfobacteriota bacterium]
MVEWVVNWIGRNAGGAIDEVGISRIDGPSGGDRKSKTQVIDDIENGDVYRVGGSDGPTIHVVCSQYGKYIRSKANNNESDNLGNLPICME